MMKGFGVACSGLLTPRDSKNIRQFVGWTVGSAISFSTATILSDVMNGAASVGWALFALTFGLSIAAVASYIRFIRESDELLRKIQLEALALGFGAGAVFMLSYRLLERLGAPQLNVSDPFLIMVLFWAAGQWMGMSRYAVEDES